MPQRRKVLLVDDSLVVARQLSKLLDEFGGYEVVAHAKNGAEAVKLYSSLEPDLVLLDIVMPMMDGLQALRAVMNLDPDARVVIVSSVGGVGQKVEEALKLGARNVISKPFETEAVRKALDALFVGE